MGRIARGTPMMSATETSAAASMMSAAQPMCAIVASNSPEAIHEFVRCAFIHAQMPHASATFHPRTTAASGPRVLVHAGVARRLRDPGPEAPGLLRRERLDRVEGGVLKPAAVP